MRESSNFWRRKDEYLGWERDAGDGVFWAQAADAAEMK